MQPKLQKPEFSHKSLPIKKLCGQKWQQMDENDREDFEEKANEVMCPILPVLNLPFPVGLLYPRKEALTHSDGYICPCNAGIVRDFISRLIASILTVENLEK